MKIVKIDDRKGELPPMFLDADRTIWIGWHEGYVRILLDNGSNVDIVPGRLVDTNAARWKIKAVEAVQALIWPESLASADSIG